MEPGTHRVCLSCGDRCCGAERVWVGEPAAGLPNNHGSVPAGGGCSHDDSAGATVHLNRCTDGDITGRHHSGAVFDNRGAGVSRRVSYRRFPCRGCLFFYQGICSKYFACR